MVHVKEKFTVPLCKLFSMLTYRYKYYREVYNLFTLCFIGSDSSQTNGPAIVLIRCEKDVDHESPLPPLAYGVVRLKSDCYSHFTSKSSSLSSSLFCSRGGCCNWVMGAHLGWDEPFGDDSVGQWAPTVLSGKGTVCGAKSSKSVFLPLGNHDILEG